MRGGHLILGAVHRSMTRLSLIHMANSIRAPTMCSAIVGLLIATVGCAALDSVWEIMLKDGRSGLATACFDAKDCERQALKACAGRSGYIKHDELLIPGLRDHKSLVEDERGPPTIEWHFRCLGDA